MRVLLHGGGCCSLNQRNQPSRSERKIEWERLHRSKRLARRRQLRHADAAREEGKPNAPRLHGTGALLLPVATRAVLAAYNSKLAIGAGGLTLAAAALYKKDGSWWIVGILVLVIGLFFQ